VLIRGCTALVLIVAGVALMRAQSPNRQVLPVPDIPGYRTLKGDFHLHTVFSDGNVWPTVRVQEAWRDGLDVIALTEHVEYHPHAADVKTDDARSFAIAKPLADQLGILLIPGVEITKPDPPKAPLVLADGSLHFNALFVTDAAALYVPVDHMEALRRARAQGAFVFWNHPRYRVPRARWFPQVARAHAEGLFQGMELVNGPEFYEEAHPWIDQRQLAILANSDAHDPVPPRSPAGPHRPITLLFARTADLDGVRDAFVSRRTAAWMGDEVWGMEEHLRALFHASVAIETPALTRKAGAAPVLRIRNTSAIPMRLAVRHAPSWFVLVPPVELGAESLTVLRPGFSAPPAGEHRIELQLEVLNLHAAPGRNLTVTVPLRVVISP
jgi:hypothetical protein